MLVSPWCKRDPRAQTPKHPKAFPLTVPLQQILSWQMTVGTTLVSTLDLTKGEERVLIPKAWLFSPLLHVEPPVRQLGTGSCRPEDSHCESPSRALLDSCAQLSLEFCVLRLPDVSTVLGTKSLSQRILLNYCLPRVTIGKYNGCPFRGVVAHFPFYLSTTSPAKWPNVRRQAREPQPGLYPLNIDNSFPSLLGLGPPSASPHPNRRSSGLPGLGPPSVSLKGKMTAHHNGPST